LKKDIVAGLGEIGHPIFTLINQAYPVIGFDQNENLIPEYENTIVELPVRFLHICIPFNEKFFQNADELIKKFNPEGVIIHSTISPKTTFQL
tara:strand:- start:462 stop:737 length:276 start_codon:yes stop_codon:yes gene_type:complete